MGTLDCKELINNDKIIFTSNYPFHDDSSGRTVNRSTSLQMRKPSIISRTLSQKKNKEGESINASLNHIENKMKHTLTFMKSGKTLRKNKAFNNRDYEDWQKHVAPYEKEGRRKGKQIINPFDFKKQQQRRKESREHFYGPSREPKLKSKKTDSPTNSGYSSGASSGSNRSRSGSRSNPPSPASHKKEERRIYLERPMEKAEEQRKSTRSGVCIKPGCDHKNARCNRTMRGKC